MDRGITQTATPSVRPTSLAPDHPELTKKEILIRDFSDALRRMPLWRSRVGYWLRRVLQLDRRYGVRFNAALESRLRCDRCSHRSDPAARRVEQLTATDAWATPVIGIYLSIRALSVGVDAC